ncbi:G-protein coupled receptor [Xylaria sp. CBS 124048]|nr:G-protein coupled receptor [Xylaria sp. CBS 124048]
MLSQDVQRALTIIERVGSVFSLTGCVIVIVTFLSSSAFRKPINRLIFYTTCGNMLANIATLIAGAYRGRLDSFGCQFQAFLIQQFLPSDALWAFAMSFNVYLTFYAKFDAEKLRRMEKWYILVCYGLPFPAALSFILISSKSAGRVYGDAVLWCWISPPWDVLQIATFYGPTWVIILVTVSIYIRVGINMYKKRRELHQMSGKYHHHPNHAFEMYATKTTEISITSSPISPTQQLQTIPSSDTFPNPDERPTSDSRVSAAVIRSVMISAEPQPPSMPQTRDGATMTHGGLSKTKWRKHNDTNKAAWAYAKCAILFFTALLVTWIPSSANRVYSLVHHGESQPALLILAALVLPLQGFWNAIIYIVTSWAAVKLFVSELTHRLEGRDVPSSPFMSSPQHPRHVSAAFGRAGSRLNEMKETESVTGLTVDDSPPASRECHAV